MAFASQSMLNQTFFDDQQDHVLMMPPFNNYFPSLHSNFSSDPHSFMTSRSLITKTLAPILPNSLASEADADADSPNLIDLSSHYNSIVAKQKVDNPVFEFPVVPQTLSLQSPSLNYWAWEEWSNYCMSMKRTCGGVQEDHHLHQLGVSAMKMKKIKGRRKTREPRFCFKTMSDVDVLDDGYKWRKYGQKVVKNTLHPRSYFRCTQDNCRVKKRVERLVDDPRMVITSYEGRHTHSPSHNEDDSQTSALLNNFFC